MRNRRFLFLIPLFTTAFLWSIHGCRQLEKQEAFFLNLSDTVNYVGITKCRSCHEDHYKTFIETGMGQSFGKASKTHSKANFHQKPVYDSKKNMYYVMDWNGDAMQITEFRLRGKDTIHKRTETISHIIGSGQHTNSHFWMDNGYVFQAPLTFYTQKGIWDLPPGYETTNTGFSRKIDLECMSCHNAIPEIADGSINKFTKIPEGIDCERCHGPGELHVSRKLAGELIDISKEVDRSIVNPAKLPWKLQVDICQRCHLQGNNVLKEGKKFTDFKPGMHLSEVFDIYMPKEQNSEFFMAGHAERLQMSKCFIGSNKNNLEQYNPKLNFTCITCHNPHVSVKKTNLESFNTACKNCHGEKGSSKLKFCSENPNKIQLEKNNCVKCHMPGNGTGDIPHVTIHDHFIRKNYKENRNPEIKTSGELYAVNEKSPPSVSDLKAYITWFEKFDSDPVYLQKADAILKEEKTNSEIEIHFYYANSNWKKIAELAGNYHVENTDAWTSYRIAKALDRNADLENAISWYKNANVKMPLQFDFGVEYANALIRNKQFAIAEKLLTDILEEHPKNEKGLINAGACAAETGKTALAIQYLKKAIALNPDLEDAWLFLAEIYLKNGDKVKAKEHLKTALTLHPQNEQAARLLRSLELN
ncbi:MAG: tetratricopeptide repeat protein [Bacteroidetes bacterium]|nr:tetratricopeptide repeat protein [Bacteroidota bacterium]